MCIVLSFCLLSSGSLLPGLPAFLSPSLPPRRILLLSYPLPPSLPWSSPAPLLSLLQPLGPPPSLCLHTAQGPQNNGSVPSTRPPGLWVPVSTTPAEPWHRKVPETHFDRAKKLHLDEIYRSVPAMPPGTEQKAV